MTGHSSADYTTYLALLRATAQREDGKRTKSFDPKRRINQHNMLYMEKGKQFTLHHNLNTLETRLMTGQEK